MKLQYQTLADQVAKRVAPSSFKPHRFGGLAVLLSICLLGLLAAPAHAVSTLLASGTIDAGDSTFDRPNSGTPPAGLSGGAYKYDVVSFTITTAGLWTIEARGADTASGTLADPWLVVYQTAFDPLNPLTNALGSDDDSGAGLNSAVVLTLSTGVTYYAVVTTYNPTMLGTYEVWQTDPPAPPVLAATHWLGQTGTTWSGANWASDGAGTPTVATPTATDNIIFSATGAANQLNTTLDADFTINSLTINSATGIGGVGGVRTLTLNNGGTINSALTLNNNLTLQSSNTLTNNGTLTAAVGSTLINNGTLTNAAAATLTNNGTLTNNLALTNAAAATLTNNGTLSNAAASTLTNNGTLTNNLALTNAATATLTNNGTLTNAIGSTLTNSGILTNAIGSTLTNDGTLTNVFGSLLNNNGTLTSTLGSTLTNNGVLANAAGSTLTSSGTLTNNLSLTNAATATLTNNGTFTNAATATLTNDGTLTSTLGSTLTNNGVLANAAGSTLTSSGTLTNNLTLTNAATATLTNNGTLTNAATAILTNIGTLTSALGSTLTNDGTLTNAAGSTLTSSGTLTNNLTLTNAATATLTNNGAFTNAATGSILHNGTLNGNATITNNGAFSGTGVVTMANNISFANNGVLTVGDTSLLVPTPSTMTFTTSGTGAVLMGVNSFINMDLFTGGSAGDNTLIAGAADQLVLMAGSALDATAGGTLVVGNPNGMTVAGGDKWNLVLLAAGAQITGDFNSNDRLDTTALNLTATQVGHFDNTTGDLTIIDVRGMEIIGAQNQGIMSAAQGIVGDINGRLFSLRAGFGGEPQGTIAESLGGGIDDGVIVGQGDGPEKPVAKVIPRSQQWEVFTTVNYANISLNSIRSQAGVDSQTWAPGVGIERHFTRYLTIGFAANLLETHQSYTDGLGSMDMQGISLSAYGSYVRRSFWADLLYSWGSFDLDSERNAAGFPVANGNTQATTNAVQLNSGWNFRIPAWKLVHGPMVGVDWLNVSVDGYSETGGGIGALSYAARNVDSLITRVGWSVSKEMDTDFAKITPQFRLSYERQNITNNNGTSVNLINQPFALTTTSEAPGQSYMVAGAGVNFEFNRDFSMLLTYQGQFLRENMDAHFGTVRFTYKF